MEATAWKFTEPLQTDETTEEFWRDIRANSDEILAMVVKMAKNAQERRKNLLSTIISSEGKQKSS